MTIYNYMTPYEVGTEQEHNILERPVLQLETPATTPTKVEKPGFAGTHKDGPLRHSPSVPNSPRSPSSPGRLSPTPEDISKLPKCQNCGLITKPEELAKTVYLCGHLCPGISYDNFCPDIEAIHPQSEGCPISSPARSALTRRRSSLSQPPMLALDESSYEDANERQSLDHSDSLGQTLTREERGVLEDTKRSEEHQSKASEEALRHMSHYNSSDAAWARQCRVEKAMEQILFGNARVSAPVVLEQVEKLRAASITQSTMTDANIGELRFTHATAKTEADKHPEEGRRRATITGERTLGLDTFMTESDEHDPDCAVCSDGEDEETDLKGALFIAKSTTKAHGCPSDDESDNSASSPGSDIYCRDFARDEPSQVWMDTSRA